MKTKAFSIFLMSAFAIFSTGCVGDMFAPREDPTRFYVLKSKDGATRIEGMEKIPLNVSLVRMPSYMTRNQIVSLYDGSARIEISDINRWPENPVDSFTRVISANLSLITGSEEIYTYPSLALGIGAADLRVTVLDCIGKLDGDLVFRARWELLRGENLKDTKRKVNIFEIKIQVDGTYNSYVNAIEKALYELSLDIAKGLKEFN